MVKIAVEHPFTSVRDALVQKGYRAEMLEKKTDAPDYDVVVVRDQEDLTDFHMSVSLVEARGRTLFEIVEEVEERLVRQGKIQSPAPMAPEYGSESGGGGGSFVAGAVTGALIGAAAGLLLAPKSGKELQEQVKAKTSDSSEKVNSSLEQAKEKADELKTKREEKKEEKELKKQEKAIEKESKQVFSWQDMRTKTRKAGSTVSNRATNLLVPIVSVVLGLIVGAIIMLVSGYSPD
ncbi:YkuS family protein [Planococcus citreus]|uniref:YkuS family protein n=1 Tax=Planococcus citreus TaxID=1373 RepID=UPI001F4F6F37|nr:YkuS family protein [Planococcus citreus]